MSQNYNGLEPSRDCLPGRGFEIGRVAFNDAPATTESMRGLLDELGKMAHEVRSSSGMVADALSGPIPSDKPDGCGTSADNVMDCLRSIRSTLRGAIENQQRIRNTLSL